ncbi:MAG: TRZ/ATZ family hydrolase [Burkholderiales bacterium]
MNAPRFDADLVIEARWIVPIEPAGTVLEDYAIALRGGNIAAILPVTEMHARCTPTRNCKLDTHVLMPGLINLHTHAAMTLLRGLADDKGLMDWLSNHIWPAEAKFASGQFVYDGTLLACAEMLKSGITCFNDMYFYPEMSGRAALDTGMRAALGIVLVEFPTGYASDAQDYLRKGLATRDAFKAEPLLSFCMAPHAPYTVSDKSFEQVLTLSEQLQIPIHTHLHETADEIRESLKIFGVRPLARLEKLGLLGPGLIAVHAVHLDAAEIALLAQQGCSIAHCPVSNMKLASGIAPTAKMLSAGINIGLGTDGTASNNRLDIFSEMRLAALAAKAGSGDAETFRAHQCLEMATLNAARALGLDQRIGSLVPGKAADLCAINLDALELSPCYDPVSHLVYAAGREHVSDVWVNGQHRVANGALVNMNESEIKSRAATWRARIRDAN